MAICYLYSSSFWIYYACNFLDINPDFLVIKVNIDRYWYLFAFNILWGFIPIIHCRLNNCTRIGYCRGTNFSKEIVINSASSCSPNRMQDISLVHVIHIPQWCRLKCDPSGVSLGLFFFLPLYTLSAMLWEFQNPFVKVTHQIMWGKKIPFFNIISCLILWR